jgi:hypothetical protein
VGKEVHIHTMNNITILDMMQLSQSEEDMRHTIYKTILKIVAYDYSSTTGRDKINEAIDKHLDYLKTTGYLKIP